MPSLTTANNSIFSPSQVIFVGLAAIILAYLIVSIVLVYHWKKYGIHQNTVKAVIVIYFAVSIVLIYTLISQALQLV